MVFYETYNSTQEGTAKDAYDYVDVMGRHPIAVTNNLLPIKGSPLCFCYLEISKKHL